MFITQTLTVDAFILDTGPAEMRMKSTINRYRLYNAPRSPNEAGYILLFAHGVGFHKELWEPTIEQLFALDSVNRKTNKATKILECWAMDCQNHGAAAVLNDEVFLRQSRAFDVTYYADAWATLCKSGLLGVINNEFQKVIISGHSGGAIASILATSRFGPPSLIPFNMLILVDPPVFSPELKNNMTPMYRIIEKTTPQRRAIWNSKEDALAFFQKRPPWNTWDRRVLKLYVDHGLRQLPTPFHPDKKGVVLICSPIDEAGPFSQINYTLEAVEQLNKICNILPVHIVLGSRSDMFSRELQDSIHDPAVGRSIASVSRVEGAGHLIVQENPEGLADAMHIILNTKIAKL